MKYSELLVPYNPWWTNITTAFEMVPLFHRPVFKEILYGLKEAQQIISITGPRRVGKSTLIKQIAKQLISEGISPEKIIYYSMDDPALYRAAVDHDGFFDALMEEARTRAGSGLMYVFLDEVQQQIKRPLESLCFHQTGERRFIRKEICRLVAIMFHG
ncbi:MAG: AAA family ATPase [Pseudomonadota bacterium]